MRVIFATAVTSVKKSLHFAVLSVCIRFASVVYVDKSEYKVFLIFIKFE